MGIFHIAAIIAAIMVIICSALAILQRDGFSCFMAAWSAVAFGLACLLIDTGSF